MYKIKDKYPQNAIFENMYYRFAEYSHDSNQINLVEQAF